MQNELKVIELYNNSDEEIINRFNSSLKSKYNITSNYEKIEADFAWLDIMEDTIMYLDNILRNPNRFIINEEEIVKVEQAKRITVESIKHLAKHTNYIQEIETLDNYVLGMDCGTTNIKAIILGQDGKKVAEASRPSKFLTPGPNMQEQDANDWWRQSKEIFQSLVAQAGQEVVDRIRGISISSHTVTIGFAVYRSVHTRLPYCLWMRMDCLYEMR